MTAVPSSPINESQPVVYESIAIIIEQENFVFERIEIAPMIVDIDIYEHLDKPYLTGVMSVLDNVDLFGSLNINGATKINMKLRLNIAVGEEGGEKFTPLPVERTFYIDSIMSSMKYQEKGEVQVIHLIEDHAYKSNQMNVNKAYAGTSTRMITRLMTELDSERRVFSTEKDDGIMKVIIPNLSPIDAMIWIKNRSVTAEGYPMYLFTTFSGLKTLNFFDLKTMLESEVMNPKQAFTFSSANISVKKDGNQNFSVPQRRVILNYEYKNTEDLYSLMSKGLMLPTTIKYTNTANVYNERNDVFFDPKDAIDRLNPEVIKGVPNYDPYLKDSYIDQIFKDSYTDQIKLQNLKTSTAQVVSSDAFSGLNGTNFAQINGYSEHGKQGEAGGYKNQMIARTLDALMKMNPLVLTVNGADFLSGTNSTTIGNKIRVKFPRNVDNRESEFQFDPKKSGDYLIYSARHSFRGDSYTVNLTGMKLSNGGLL